VSPREEATFTHPEPLMCVIDVRGVYRFLADRAGRRGAEIVTGAVARGPLLEGGRVTGCTIEREGTRVDVRARVVVDAGGYRAAISKAAGLHPGFTRFGVGAEHELVAPECSQREAVLIVGNDYAPAGYAWVFPWGGERVRVGVGVHHADVRDSPKELLEPFIRDADRFGVNLAGSSRGEYHFGLVPTDGMPTRLVGDGIMAVGDAACQATLVVGEGIRLAMTAGWMAGTVAARALAAGPATREALLPYEREFRRRYGLNLRIGGIMNRRLAASTDGEWDHKVRLVKSLPPGLVPKLLQSEFPVPGLLRWVAARPHLWYILGRYAIRPRLT
jgi:digeranylgeranylglycerophospholipid reductase